jgi:hypothetical protein
MSARVDSKSAVRDEVGKNEFCGGHDSCRVGCHGEEGGEGRDGGIEGKMESEREFKEGEVKRKRDGSKDASDEK